METSLIQPLIAALISSLIGIRSFRRKSLDLSGAITDFLVMTLHIAAGSRFGPLILVFFFTSSLHVLWVCLETGLRLLHPFMPFVSEELWQRLPQPRGLTKKESIMLCEYPSAVENLTACTQEEVNKIIETAKLAQKVWAKTPLWKRAELLHKAAAILKEQKAPIAECLVKEIAKPAKDAVTEVVRSGDLVSYCAEEGVRILGGGKFLVSDSFPGNERTKYCLTSKVLLSITDEDPTDCAFQNVNENLKVYLKVEVDIEAERENIRNKLTDTQKHTEY